MRHAHDRAHHARRRWRACGYRFRCRGRHLPSCGARAEVARAAPTHAQRRMGFAPLDARVRVQGCAKDVSIDLPFASRETIRARCFSPSEWQLYLRVVFNVDQKPANMTPQKASLGTERHQVVVSKSLIRRGTTLKAEMFEVVEKELSSPGNLFLSSTNDLTNVTLKRDLMPGLPIRSTDLQQAVLVKRGQMVLLTISKGTDMSISARLEALQDGKIGEQVKLRNRESGRFISGIVIGVNMVQGL